MKMSPLIPKLNSNSFEGGFPPGVAFTPVPSPLLGSLLETVDDPDELRIVLRAIWLLNLKPASKRYATSSELCNDGTVAAMLKAYGKELESKVEEGLSSAIKRGIFLRLNTGSPITFALNTEPSRRQYTGDGPLSVVKDAAETVPAPEFDSGSDAAATAYEENIGIITPVVAEKLRALLDNYGEEKVLEAINTAALEGARNMRFIEVVLKNNVGKSPNAGRSESEQRTAEALAADRERFARNYVRRHRSN